MWEYRQTDELYHHGVRGQKWGVRRYQNEDGTLTPLGYKHLSFYQQNELSKAHLKWGKRIKRSEKKLNKVDLAYKSSKQKDKEKGKDKESNRTKRLREKAIKNYTKDGQRRALSLLESKKIINMTKDDIKYEELARIKRATSDYIMSQMGSTEIIANTHTNFDGKTRVSDYRRKNQEASDWNKVFSAYDLENYTPERITKQERQAAKEKARKEAEKKYRR